jgi:four helix bundle protein
MKISKFEDVIGWQKGQDGALFIYNHFGKNLDFGFRNQICRASVSISNNIAEGFDRGSRKEFIRFMYISKGSNSEVKSMLYLAKRLDYVDENIFQEGLDLFNEIGKILTGFIKYLESLAENKT